MGIVQPILQNKKDYKRVLWTTVQQQLDNLEELDKFLETQNLPKLNCKETQNLNRPLANKETGVVIKNIPVEKSSGPDSFTDQFH